MNQKLTLQGNANDCLTHTNQERGITLVALIITIIILVIIAGVAITVAYNSGIVGIAINGATNYAEEGVAENRIFNNAMEHISNALEKLKNGSSDNTGNPGDTGEELPENTKDTEAGTIVATSEEWIRETPAEISTLDDRNNVGCSDEIYGNRQNIIFRFIKYTMGKL